MQRYPERPPHLSIIILNTNRKADTLACLATIEQSSYESIDTIVLDNASTDDSVEAISAEFPAVEIVHLTENKGYAGNNNVGIDIAFQRHSDWVFVLNEDTLLAPDCLTRLIEAGEMSNDIGIVGPMVYHANEPHVIQSAGGTMDQYLRPSHLGENQIDRGQFPETCPVDWISGCALLIRREVIEEIGSLDERFFYYWEETEWCLRTRKAGWKIMHVPAAKLWHKGVQKDYNPSPNVTYYNTRNRLLMLAKHHAPIAAWAVAWQELLRTYLSWSIRPKWRDLHAHRDALQAGVTDFLRRRWGPGRSSF